MFQSRAKRVGRSPFQVVASSLPLPTNGCTSKNTTGRLVLKMGPMQHNSTTRLGWRVIGSGLQYERAGELPQICMLSRERHKSSQLGLLRNLQAKDKPLVPHIGLPRYVKKNYHFTGCCLSRSLISSETLLDPFLQRLPSLTEKLHDLRLEWDLESQNQIKHTLRVQDGFL